MATKAQKVKLGAFLVVTTLVVAGMAVAFLSMPWLDDAEPYFVTAEDAKGLHRGSPVYLRGVRVGQVDGFSLEAGRAVVRLAIDREATIPSDAKAYFELEGPTGLKSVNILEGTAMADPLPPGSFIPKGETLLDRLQASGDRIVARLEEVLESLNRLTGSVADASEKIDFEKIDGILSDTETLVRELTRTTRNVDKLVRDTRRPLLRSLERADQAIAKMDAAAAGAGTAIDNLDRTAAELRGVVRNNDADLRATVRNMRQATESFEELGRELRNQPNRLIFGGAPPERELP